MIFFRIALAMVFPALLVACSTSEFYDKTPEGLLEKTGNGGYEPAFISAADRSDGVPRCLKLNNYWCLKAPTNRYWLGQTGRDSDGHARFRHPVYAARAFARVMRTYHYTHGLTTPQDIVKRYAPSIDCPNPTFYCPVPGATILTPTNERVVRIDRRDAIYRAQIPSGYRLGKGCTNPVFNCQDGYNPNWNYFDYIAENTGVGLDEDLGLFDDEERFNLRQAVAVFQAFARFEISTEYLVETDLILQGIQMEEQDYFNHPSYSGTMTQAVYDENQTP